MRSLPVLITLLLLTPAASAALLPDPFASTPVVSVAVDRTHYRADVDKALAWAAQYQKPDGGIYEYAFIGKDLEAGAALRAFSRDATHAATGPILGGLLRYYEETQAVDGTWGTSLTKDAVTAEAVDGLLRAGLDPNTAMLKRARLYIEMSQRPNGAWDDGGNTQATYLTAQNLRNLLAFGYPADDARVQNAVRFLVDVQYDNGGYPPVPSDSNGAAYAALPVPTGLTVYGLEAYLRAPKSGSELVADAEVAAAIEAAFAFLDATLDWERGYWQGSIGATVSVLMPVASYFANRDLARPTWFQQGVQSVLRDSDPETGAILSWNGAEILDATLDAAAALLDLQKDLTKRDSVSVRVSVNTEGEYQDGPVTLSLVNAQGVVVQQATTTTGLGTLAWSKAPRGFYTLRAEAPGAVAHETVLGRI